MEFIDDVHFVLGGECDLDLFLFVKYRVDSYDYFVFFFFFSSRRRHTRFDCNWSSDVCSSDLAVPVLLEVLADRVDRPHPRHDDPGAPVFHGLPTSARILPTSWFSTASRVTRMAFFIALASDRPWAITATPSMPRSGAPPYSRQSTRARSSCTRGRMRAPPTFPDNVLG